MLKAYKCCFLLVKDNPSVLKEALANSPAFVDFCWTVFGSRLIHYPHENTLLIRGGSHLQLT